MEKSDIITGQYVQISQTPASIGERMAAQLIDWILEFAYAFLLLTLNKEPDVVFSILLVTLPILLYCPLCEIFNHGQTIGKRLMKLRVVMKDGTTPSLGAYLLRWLLFLVDGPLTSFCGIIVILVTRHRQRLGDLAAGTLVIRIDSYSKIQVSLDEFSHLGHDYQPTYPQAADLSLEQVNLIAKTIELDLDDPRVHQLAQKVKEVFGITQSKESTDFSFLTRVTKDYQYYALEEI